MSSELREVLVKHAEAINSVVEGLVVIDDELSDEDFPDAILDAAEKVPDGDDGWKKVPEETRDWVNDIFRQEAADKEAAEAVGVAIAKQAMSVGIKCVSFDRNRYRYHGRVKALAETARKTGLAF